MIRAGIPIGALQPYLRQRAWLIDAARLLRRTPEDLAAEMIGTMLRSGDIVRRDQRIHAAADHVPVAPGRLDVPYPREWPPAVPPREPALMSDGDGLQRQGDRCLDAGRRATMARQRDVQVVTLLGPGPFSGNEQPVDTTLQRMDRADAGPGMLCA